MLTILVWAYKNETDWGIIGVPQLAPEATLKKASAHQILKSTLDFIALFISGSAHSSVLSPKETRGGSPTVGKKGDKESVIVAICHFLNAITDCVSTIRYSKISPTVCINYREKAFPRRRW